MQKLTVVLGTIAEDVAKEKAGLQRRYEAAMAEAAFSMNALEDPNAATASPAAVDGMSSSLDRYSRRISQLDQQIAFFDDVQETVQRFMQESEIDTAAQG